MPDLIDLISLQRVMQKDPFGVAHVVGVTILVALLFSIGFRIFLAE